MSRLIPCSSCRRHVKRSEAACPFCAAPMPSAAPVAAARPAPPGTKRAALFAMGISLAASACEADNSVPIYGAPIVPVGGSSGASGSGNAGGNGGTAGAGGNAGSSGTGGASTSAGGSDVTDAGNPSDAAPPTDAAAADAGDGDAAP
jgi:uncharacterized membrane protein YgcG